MRLSSKTELLLAAIQLVCGCFLIWGGIYLFNLFKALTILVTAKNLSIFGLCLVTIGAVVLLLGLFTIIGLLKSEECQYFLLTVAVSAAIIASLQVAIGIATMAVNDEIAEQLGSDYGQVILRYDESKVAIEIDRINTDLGCCGVENATDWPDVNSTSSDSVLPKSCCFFNKTDDNSCTVSVVTAHKVPGCSRKLLDYSKGVIHLAGSLALSLGCVHLIPLTILFLQSCPNRRNSYYEELI